MQRTLDIALQIGCAPNTVRRHAHLLGLGRQRKEGTSPWLFTEAEAEQIRRSIMASRRMGRPLSAAQKN